MDDRYDQEASNEDDANQFVRESRVDLYVCPSDQAMDELVRPVWGTPRDRDCRYQPSSYRCVTGRSDGHPNWWDCQQEEWSTGVNPLPHGWRGVLHHVGTAGLTCETFAAVRDGTSNTLAIGERHIFPDRKERGTMWAATAVYYNAGTAVPQSRILMVDYIGCKEMDPDNFNECKRGWGSFHPGGINFAAADGAVRFLSLNIDMNLFCELASIAGSEVGQLP